MHSHTILAKLTGDNPTFCEIKLIQSFSISWLFCVCSQINILNNPTMTPKSSHKTRKFRKKQEDLALATLMYNQTERWKYRTEHENKIDLDW